MLPNLYLTYNFPFTDTFLPALWWMSLFKKVFTLRHVDWICLRKKICKSPINTQNSVRFVVWCKVCIFSLWLPAPSWHSGWLLDPSLSYFTWAKQIITGLFVVLAQSPLWWHLKSLLLSKPGTEIQSWGRFHIYLA